MVKWVSFTFFLILVRLIYYTALETICLIINVNSLNRSFCHTHTTLYKLAAHPKFSLGYIQCKFIVYSPNKQAKCCF